MTAAGEAGQLTQYFYFGIQREISTDSARRSSPCAARGDACLRHDACDAAEADVAGRGVDGLCLAGGGPVAQAVVGCAQM